MKFWTYTLSSGSLNLNAVDGASFVSIQCDSTSGSCSVLGGIPFKGVNATAVVLTAGQGVNIQSATPFSPLDGITITWIAGSVDILIGL